MVQQVTLNGRLLDLDYEPLLQVGIKPVWRTPIEINGRVISGVNINGYDYPPCPASNVLYIPGLPGQGSTIWDRSGNGNNGTIAGATWKRLNSGLWYLFFDGATDKDDIVSVADAATIQNIWDAGGTVEIWVNPGSDGEDNTGRVLDKRLGWALSTVSELGGLLTLIFWVDFSTRDGYWHTTLRVLPINRWSKVSLTYDSSSADNNPIIYINGISYALTESSTPLGTRVSDTGRALNFGNALGTTPTFDGGQTLWSISKTIKTAAQILQGYQVERHLFGV